MPFDALNFIRPTVENDETLRLLTEGQARIAKGWTRYVFYRPDSDGDGYCARGALSRVHPADRDGDAALILAEGYLFAALDRKWLSRLHVISGWGTAGEFVATYNNLSETTHADIIALFDRAIAARRVDVLTMAGA